MKIIESLASSIILLPIDTLRYQEGNLVSLQDYGFTLAVNLKPFGIIEKIVNNIYYIAYESMVFETSLCEFSYYKERDFIYGSPTGLITNIKHSEESVLLGYVKNVRNNILTIEWI